MYNGPLLCTFYVAIKVNLHDDLGPLEFLSKILTETAESPVTSPEFCARGGIACLFMKSGRNRRNFYINTSRVRPPNGGRNEANSW